MTTTPTAQQVLMDTIFRYQHAFYDPPKLIRGTPTLHRMLDAEFRDMMIYDPNMPFMPSDEMKFMGVRIKFDLPGKAVAALTVHDHAS